MHRSGIFLTNLHIFMGFPCVDCKITLQNKDSLQVNKYQRAGSHPQNFAKLLRPRIQTLLGNRSSFCFSLINQGSFYSNDDIGLFSAMFVYFINPARKKTLESSTTTSPDASF